MTEQRPLKVGDNVIMDEEHVITVAEATEYWPAGSVVKAGSSGVIKKLYANEKGEIINADVSFFGASEEYLKGLAK